MEKINLLGLDKNVQIEHLDKLNEYIRMIHRHDRFWFNLHPTMEFNDYFGKSLGKVEMPTSNEILCDCCNDEITDEYIPCICYIDEEVEFVGRTTCQNCIKKYFSNLKIIKHDNIEKLYNCIYNKAEIIEKGNPISTDLAKILIFIYESSPNWQIKDIFAKNPFENMIKFVYSIFPIDNIDDEQMKLRMLMNIKNLIEKKQK